MYNITKPDHEQYPETICNLLFDGVQFDMQITTLAIEYRVVC